MDEFVETGLLKLRREAEASGIYEHHDEVSVSITIRGSTYHRYQLQPEHNPGSPSVHVPFSDEALDLWAEELKRQCYVPGQGTWTKAEIHIFKSEPSRVDVLADSEWAKLSASVSSPAEYLGTAS